MVLHAGAAFCASFTLGNVASFIFGVSDVNLGDKIGGIILGGGWGFWFLGYDCCISLSTLGGGLVLFVNCDDGWAIVCVLLNWFYVPNFLLVYRYVGYSFV